MMKKPGFSRAKDKPFKLGPLMTVASVMEARSLNSPASAVTVAAAAALSGSYLALNEAFISFSSFLLGRVREDKGNLCPPLVAHPN